MSGTDAAALAERVRELEAENAALADRAARDRPRGSRWRAVGSAMCITIAAVLVPVSIVAAWARVQLVDEDAFVATLAPLITESAVQELLIDETLAAVEAQVDFRALTDDLFDGIEQLGVAPRAAAALNLLRQPAADALSGFVETGVTRVVESDAFAGVWATTLRGGHRALTLTATSDGGGIVVIRGDRVGIELAPVVAGLKETLVEQGIGVAGFIPTIDRTVFVGSAEGLVAIRTGYAVASAVGWWLPVGTLALFILGIALARRRSVAVLGTGIGTALGAASLGTFLGIGALAVTSVAGGLDLSPSALGVIYAHLVRDMQTTAWTFAVLGALVALGGWVAGRSSAARRTRAVAGSAWTAVRDRVRPAPEPAVAESAAPEPTAPEPTAPEPAAAVSAAPEPAADTGPEGR